MGRAPAHAPGLFLCAKLWFFPLILCPFRLVCVTVPRAHSPNVRSFIMPLTNFTTTYVVILSAKSFVQASKDIQAEMGRARTETLGEKLSASEGFAGFTE